MQNNSDTSSQDFKKYFTNTSWLLMGRVFFMVISLFVGIYVARYLGPQRYGLLSYAVSFVALFSALATLGLDQIVVREFVRGNADTESILGTVFLLKLTGALVVLSLLSIVLYFTNTDTQTKILILIIAGGLFFQSLCVIDLYFQSQVVSKYAVFAQIAQIVISALIKIFLIFLKADLIWFALVMTINNLMFAVGLLFFLHKRYNSFISTWKFNRALAKRLLLESWPLALSGIVATIYMKIDQVMIREMLNAEAVGLYSAAVQLSEIWYFLPAIFLNSLFPAIIILHKNNQAKYHMRLQQLHDLLSMLALPIAIFFFFFSETIITILFGEQYHGAGAILSVHIWAGMFIFPGNVRAHLIIVENKQVTALIFRTIGAILNIFLNYLFIPKYGPIGAAWATLASYVFPVCFIALFDPLIRLTVLMTFKSYLLPARVILYRRSLYDSSFSA